MTNKTLTVIVGAGSSHDCVDNIGDQEKAYQPPLVQDLFKRGEATDQIFERYPRAEALADEIRSVVAQGQNLESFLRECESSPKPLVRHQYRHVPLYLRRYLWEVSKRWGKVGGTKFDTLVRQVDRSPYERVPT